MTIGGRWRAANHTVGLSALHAQLDGRTALENSSKRCRAIVATYKCCSQTWNNNFMSVLRTTMRNWKRPTRKDRAASSLLVYDKNYARRIVTLFRKAHEAIEGINEKHGDSRCRIAVIQELDGHRSVYLSHQDDESWPPPREHLLRV